MNPTSQNKLKHWSLLSRSVLNGVIGDYLVQTHNPLAIKMDFYHQSERLTLDSAFEEQFGLPLSNKVVVFLHGLTNLESIWDFDKEITAVNDRKCAHYGELLQEEFGFTPLFLRYNTGVSSEANGREFAALLDRLCATYPMPIDELMLVGFSMGGLVSRYAQHFAQQSSSPWLKSLSHCVYLGTPHEGAPLEKLGDLLGHVVAELPLEYVNIWAEWISIRSTGIKGLKHGMEPLSQNHGDEQACLSFYPRAQHYFMGGDLGSVEGGVLSKLLGDGLVRKSSAMPRSAPGNSLSVHFENMPHLRLAHSKRVYAQMAEWLNPRTKTSMGKTQALKTCAATPPSGLSHKEINSDHQEVIVGAIELAIDAYDKIVDTTERKHRSIAAEPFNALRKIPVVNQISAPVEAAHNGISDIVYASLKVSGRWSKKLPSLLKSRSTYT